MPHFISIHALFVLMDIVSSGLVDQSLRVRQAPNPDPLQYCGMKVELGGCPYECVQGKCPCYSYCADGPQVCGLANDPLQIAVYTYCVSCQFLPIVKIETLLKEMKTYQRGDEMTNAQTCMQKDPDNSIFNRCLQYCTDHCVSL